MFIRVRPSACETANVVVNNSVLAKPQSSQLATFTSSPILSDLWAGFPDARAEVCPVLDPAVKVRR